MKCVVAYTGGDDSFRIGWSCHGQVMGLCGPSGVLSTLLWNVAVVPWRPSQKHPTSAPWRPPQLLLWMLVICPPLCPTKPTADTTPNPQPLHRQVPSQPALLWALLLASIGWHISSPPLVEKNPGLKISTLTSQLFNMSGLSQVIE